MLAYKIVDGVAQLGDFLNVVPDDYTQYVIGKESQELIDAMNYKTPEEIRVGFKSARDTALSDNVYTLADGSVYQVRPSDLSNFQLAIQLGVSKNWVLKNNTTRLTTVAELTEVMDAGIAQAEVIWSEYATALGAM